MNRKFMLIICLTLFLSFSFSISLWAQETASPAAQTEVKSTAESGTTEGTGPAIFEGKVVVKDATVLFLWTIIAAIFGLALAAIGGAWSQSKALRTAMDNIGRNPAAADSIRGILIIGLALIESLVIYVLLIDFIVIGKWGKYFLLFD